MSKRGRADFPLYIVSKGRWETRHTSKALTAMGVRHNIVVEHQERDKYAAAVSPMVRIVVLDKKYQDDYETCDSLGDAKSKGPGPARNFIWDHSISEGHSYHWVMDDNIQDFYRFQKNRLIRVGQGGRAIFSAMEDFVLRYSNVGMAGPNYEMFVTRRNGSQPPFILNTRIYSCNFIRNDIPFRWRGRYNEDTILSLDMMKAGWCTVQYNAFLQKKLNTQQVKGGNTAEFYAKEGTMPKSKMQVAVHPDVSTIVYKFNRWHHHVDYSPFKKNLLKKRKGLKIKKGPNEYGLSVREV